MIGLKGLDDKPADLSDKGHVEIQTEIHVSVMPYYIFNYLSKKGVGGDGLLNDIVLDHALGVEDIAIILYMNSPSFMKGLKDGLGLNNYNIGDSIFSKRPIMSQSLVTKMDAARTYSYSKAIQKDVETLFNVICNETSPSYRFVKMGTKIWLIVHAGFILMMKNPEKRLDFYRDYLRTVEEIATFRAVSRTSVFSHYVEELLA